MSSQYFPPYGSSSNNIKVELDLSSYPTKTDLKNITHVDVSSYASKVNLAALKTEVDKIDTDKLKTVPDDLAKLSNVVKNDVVKKTDYNTKVTSIESQIAGVTKNTLDNLGDITKRKAFDTSNFVLKTKLASDVTTLENKIDTVDKKIPDISGLAPKTSLTSYLQTATFNSKVTEVENKIKYTDIIAKSANTKANTIRSDLTGYAKKADVATYITAIKNDYVTNASLTSQLNDLKSQHIATEVTTIDNKAKKHASDVLALENKLKQKEDIVDENQRELSFARGFYFYMDQSYLVDNCKIESFSFAANRISTWKSAGIFNYVDNSNMNAVGDTSGNSPDLKNDGRMHVYLSGNYFKQGYGICFDEGCDFSHTIREGGFHHTTDARNVLIFGADLSFSKHATNRANNIYVMVDLFIQGINDTAIYAEKMFYRIFTDPGKKFMLSLHYNGDDSYLFVNGRQELKFKCKTDQLVKEKLCIGNLSDQWTTSESEETGLYGNIYDFVVDYQQIVGVKAIYDMHRYLMIKHNISP